MSIRPGFLRGHTILTMTCAFFLAAICGFIAIQSSKTISAASTSGFKPGNIMSDAVMGNYTSMTKDDIQRFLTSKNPCNNRDYNQYKRLESNNPKYDWHWQDGHFVCLSEERFGDGMVIGSGQTAAEIIYQAAQDYHVNPQVLIVVLQKETGLVTDPIPNNGDYRKAMGFGCPDTAACDSKYYGLKNQIRSAAKLFHDVLEGGWSNYPVGKTLFVQYNPNRSCGGSNIYIENRATSALYRYTPYQPNQSALNAGYGAGDACGAYGNRNFYLYFTDWFGSTQVFIDGSAITIPDGIYTVQSKASNARKVLDVAGGKKENGTNIALWDNNNSNNQKWQFARQASGYYTIASVDSGKYLDLNGAVGEPGRNISLWGKSGSCAQEWKLIQTRDGYITFESACRPGMVIDVAGGEGKNNANVNLWVANNQDNQKWSLLFGRTLSDGLYNINTKLSSTKAVDVYGASHNNGANISLWDKHGDTSQRWYVTYNANGDYYTLRNPISGKYLDLNGAEAKPGANISLWEQTNSCAQRWKISKNSDNTYTLLSTCSLGYAADVDNGKTTNGANILAWPYSGSNNQRWQFTGVAQAIANGTYIVNSKLAHIKAMDVTGGSASNGTNVEIWTQHGGAAAQQWRVVYHRDRDTYTFQNPKSGKYLDLNGAVASNGENIHMWSGNSSCAQNWLVRKTADNYYQLVSSCNEGYVIDVAGGSTKDGVNVLLWPNQSTDNQKWKFEAVKK